MYARVITFSGADSDKRDAALEMIRGTVLPMLRTYDGYEGYVMLTDEDEMRGSPRGGRLGLLRSAAHGG